MNIHYIQHVPYEGPASIKHWSASNGHNLTSTQIYKNEILPEMDTIDWLIIMGGPMNICQEDEYDWLAREKNFIWKAIAARKVVVGICLGAQLIADSLGARVYRNSHKEIGWFPIAFSVAAQQSEICGFLPAHLTVFHWHGDTFDIPENALLLASSEACQNQAFLYNGRVLGLQFHLESTRESVQHLVENCRDELVQSPYIQGADEILMQGSTMFKKNNNALSGIFNRLPQNQ